MGNDNTPCNSTLQFASRKPDNIIEARDTRRCQTRTAVHSVIVSSGRDVGTRQRNARRICIRSETPDESLPVAVLF